MAEIKRVTLHPLNPDGTIDTNTNLYPKTLTTGIVNEEGEAVNFPDDSNLVHNTGNENIGGIKTFTDPIRLKKDLCSANLRFITQDNVDELHLVTYSNDVQTDIVFPAAIDDRVELATKEDCPTNLKNGSGENSLQQKGNIASGKDSFAHGLNNIASNVQSHAEGHGTQAVGNFSHSEGQANVAWADISHAEGVGNIVGNTNETEVRSTGEGSHAEGYGNIVFGKYAHVSGRNNIVWKNYSTVVGEFNNDASTAMFAVGNGTDNSHRSNAFEVWSDGRATVGKDPINSMDVATKQYVDNASSGGEGTKLYVHKINIDYQQYPGYPDFIIITGNANKITLTNSNVEALIRNSIAAKWTSPSGVVRYYNILTAYVESNKLKILYVGANGLSSEQVDMAWYSASDYSISVYTGNNI